MHQHPREATDRAIVELHDWPGRGPALEFVDRMKDTVCRFGENISGSALEIRGIGKGARRMLQQ